MLHVQNPNSSELNILSFNAQGYYLSKEWLKEDYGSLISRISKFRKISDNDWINLESIERLLSSADLWLAQEVPSPLAKLIQKKFSLVSVRQHHSFECWEGKKPVTTDIFYNPKRLKTLEAVEISAHENSFWKNCHKSLLTKFSEITTDKEFVAVSSHLEAGISKKQFEIRVEQLMTLIHRLSHLDNEKIIIGLDANDLEKRKKKIQTKIEELFQKSGFQELVQGNKTYRPEFNELPFGKIISKIFGLGDSLDKLAIKNLNAIQTSIVDPGSSASDHNAIFAKIII